MLLSDLENTGWRVEVMVRILCHARCTGVFERYIYL